MNTNNNSGAVALEKVNPVDSKSSEVVISRRLTEEDIAQHKMEDSVVNFMNSLYSETSLEDSSYNEGLLWSPSTAMLKPALYNLSMALLSAGDGKANSRLSLHIMQDLAEHGFEPALVMLNAS